MNYPSVKTTIFAIKYNGGANQGTQNILPLAIGRLKNGTRVLICRTLAGEVKTLDNSKVTNPRRVSKRTVEVERPCAWISKLGTLEQEGIPASWLSFTEMPPERVTGFDPETRAVETIPYSYSLYQ